MVTGPGRRVGEPSAPRGVYRVTIWLFFFSSRRRHTRSKRDWSSDVCSSDLSSGNSRVSSSRAIDEDDFAQILGPAREELTRLFPELVPSSERPPEMLSLGSVGRSEERRVGKECRSRWGRSASKKMNRTPL